MFRRLLLIVLILPIFLVFAAASLEAPGSPPDPDPLDGEVLETVEAEADACRGGVHQVPVRCLPYGEELVRWSKARDLDPVLVRAVAMAESSLRPGAIRREPKRNDTSYGLMQILYTTAQEVGYTGEPEGLLDAATNLKYGTAYLKKVMDRVGGDVRLALAAYNAGPTRVSRLIDRYGPSYEHIRAHLPRSTRAYIQRVLNWYRHFEILEGSMA